MDNHELTEIIMKYTLESDSKVYIKCGDVFKIAEEHNCELALLAQLINKENIKIKSCQLGCF